MSLKGVAGAADAREGPEDLRSVEQVSQTGEPGRRERHEVLSWTTRHVYKVALNEFRKNSIVNSFGGL